MIEHDVAGIRYLTYGLFDPFVKVTNVVTTRQSGSSRPPYDTLNLGLHVGDDPGAVLENRAVVAQVLGFEPETWTLGEQVHGAAVSVVHAGDRGRGAVVVDDAVGEADALVTNEPGIPLAILVADCVAVSLYDPARHVAAVAHAGWKGTLARVVEKTVDTMANVFGADPSDIVAGLGPSVGKCHYTVGRDVVDGYIGEFAGDAHLFLSEGPADVWRLDLAAANVYQLARAGLRKERFEAAGWCTACEPALFYSHRRDGARTGRFASVIMLHSSGRRLY
jgi:YfiH family protein